MHRVRPLEQTREQPLGSDALGREKYLRNIISFAESANEPLVIGIPGPWGCGKTTLLTGLDRILTSESSAIVFVYFDAWKYDFLSDPIEGLLEALHDRMPPSSQEQMGVLARLSRFASGLTRRFAAPISGIAAGAASAAVGAHLGVAGVSGAAAAAAVENFLDRAEGAIEGSLRRDVSSEFLDTLNELVESLPGSESGCKLIFAIDELDRCRPDYALKVLERIKHYFSVQRTLFLIAYDPEYLGCAARAVYGASFDADRYIRRFIDFELPTPAVPHRKAIENFIDRLDFKTLESQISERLDYLQDYISTISSVLGMSLRDCEQLLVRIRLFFAQRTSLSMEDKLLVPIALAGRVVGTSSARTSDFPSWLSKTFADVANRISRNQELSHVQNLLRAASYLVSGSSEDARSMLNGLDTRDPTRRFLATWLENQNLSGRSLINRIIRITPAW